MAWLPLGMLNDRPFDTVSARPLFGPQEQYGLIEDAYGRYYDPLMRYFSMRGCGQQAQDLAQDVFVRLLGYGKRLRKEGIGALLFTIARNLLNDHLRQQYRNRTVSVETIDEVLQHNAVEEAVDAAGIARMELEQVGKLSPQRKAVYIFTRFDGMPADRIAEMLSLSKRTVENHILAARKTVREAMAAYCG